jgi:hypothetical protein
MRLGLTPVVLVSGALFNGPVVLRWLQHLDAGQILHHFCCDISESCSYQLRLWSEKLHTYTEYVDLGHLPSDPRCPA